LTLTVLLQVAVGGLLMGLIYALVAAGLSLIFGNCSPHPGRWLNG
jgi:branched-subunit amino acid ABC-type transport system permease component